MTPNVAPRLLTKGIVVLAVLLAIPATASAADSNAIASRAYVKAAYAFAKASVALEPTIEKRVRDLKHKLLSSCPKVALGSPQNEESRQLSYEVAGALWSVSYGADAGAIATFASAVKPLRWQSSHTTHVADAYVKALSQLAALPTPNVCGEARAWRRSGYETLPAATVSFVRKVEAIEPEAVTPALLRPYLGAAERGTLTSTERLQEKLLNFETFFGGNTWQLLLEKLEINS